LTLTALTLSLGGAVATLALAALVLIALTVGLVLGLALGLVGPVPVRRTLPAVGGLGIGLGRGGLVGVGARVTVAPVAGRGCGSVRSSVGTGRGHPGQVQDHADDVGLLGAARGLSAQGLGDRGELGAVLALEAVDVDRIKTHSGDVPRGRCSGVDRGCAGVDRDPTNGSRSGVDRSAGDRRGRGDPTERWAGLGGGSTATERRWFGICRTSAPAGSTRPHYPPHVDRATTRALRQRQRR